MIRGQSWNLIRYAVLAGCMAMTVSAQRATGQSVTINDPRPLAKAAEILQARFGVPISYEDVSTYTYSGDLEEPNEVRKNNPAAKTLPPKQRTLGFTAPPFSVSYYPVQPADKGSVTSLLQSVIDQHNANGNAGQFRMIETPVGLTIVPSMARDSLGNFMPDQSLLDLRISLLDYDERRGVSLYQAFGQALSAACGKPVAVDGLWMPEAKIQATNEVARDVLVKILMALGPSPMGVSSSDGKRSPPPVITWSFITEPGIDTSHPTTYHLHFRNVVMEKLDLKGNVVGHGIVTRPTQ